MQMEKNLSDAELKALIEDVFQKLTKKSEADGRGLSEMHKTLNWLIALTTLFMGPCFQNISTLGFLSKFVLGFIFISSITSIILLFNYINISWKYNESKEYLLSSLHTHKLELVYNLELVKKKLQEQPVNIPSFLERFKFGEFVPDYEKER